MSWRLSGRLPLKSANLQKIPNLLKFLGTIEGSQMSHQEVVVVNK